MLLTPHAVNDHDTFLENDNGSKIHIFNYLYSLDIRIDVLYFILFSRPRTTVFLSETVCAWFPKR